MNIELFTIIKNSNQWLDDWVRYHLSIGISHILIYDNNDGKNDYPMSDYIIKECTKKTITIINKRNQIIDLNDETKKIIRNLSYDFFISININDYIYLKDNRIKILDTLSLKNIGLLLKVYPYHNDGTIDLNKYNYYSPIKLYKSKNLNSFDETSDLYIKKIEY